MTPIILSREDRARDLSADLLLLDHATPGPWFAVSEKTDWDPPLPYRCYYIAAGSPGSNHMVVPPAFWPREEQEIDPCDCEMIAAARTGWRVAILRALAAEQRLAMLEGRSP